MYALLHEAWVCTCVLKLLCGLYAVIGVLVCYKLATADVHENLLIIMTLGDLLCAMCV